MNEPAEIRSFVAELLRRKGDQAPFTDSESLILGGRLQSIDAVEIVVFLENRFGLDFAAIGFDQTQIDSIDLIAALTGKRPAAESTAGLRSL
ncbi:Acyl carrier protein [Candidatus Sulfotelmatobacter kueseliae]|uniref:Acyl carrier protein n=1 Tax=Candidatus Sulfotelmatobacter kueseliae TaxID=2042962 RepID=A0A2U3LA99_9BACT|nr:Acyl carrier protein [Candidatus Sulfotelmatobacter kueseliae]